MKTHNNILISIIVPVYNTEKYIGACLDSIIPQLSKKSELIIVDDGSTDKSASICLDKINGFRNIIIEKRENMGVSSARNRGMELSNGRYALFVDSDDILAAGAIETLEAIIARIEPDIVSFGYYKMYKNKIICLRSKEAGEISREKAIEEMLLEPSFGGYIANKLFSMDIIKRGKIRFNEEKKISEDLQFVHAFLGCANIIHIENKCLYYYRMRKTSALNSATDSALSPIAIYWSILEKNPTIARDSYNTFKYLAYKYNDLNALRKYENLFGVKKRSIKSAMYYIYFMILPVGMRNVLHRTKYLVRGYFR